MVFQLSSGGLRPAASDRRKALHLHAWPATMRSVLTHHLLSWVVPAAALLAWEAMARCGLINARLMPPPSRVVLTLCDLARSGDLSTHVVATVSRILVGFAAGALVGTGVAALTGASRLARQLLDPTVQALRAIPSIADVARDRL
jgi:sulfonate transport system permease protein